MKHYLVQSGGQWHRSRGGGVRSAILACTSQSVTPEATANRFPDELPEGMCAACEEDILREEAALPRGYAKPGREE